jgi:hypothetical protein
VTLSDFGQSLKLVLSQIRRSSSSEIERLDGVRAVEHLKFPVDGQQVSLDEVLATGDSVKLQ